ncbi:MAG: hypothetical protein M0017_02290 [Desulfobacteraceae bacterium]|nr:hypothetical protein [Desulfobacteraceae bacterium]
MSKKLMTLALALSFAAATVAVSFAADVTCTVKSVSGTTVTMDCKDASKLAAGSTVTVKAAAGGAKKKAIEGC